MKLLGKDCEIDPHVPEPLPLKKFMVYIGPAMMTTALGLGTSELILYPRLTAEFGTGWIGMMVLSLVFQTVWAQQMARWTVLTGEHGVKFGLQPGLLRLVREVVRLVWVGLVVEEQPGAV